MTSVSGQGLPCHGVARVARIGAAYAECRQRVNHDRVHSSIVVLDAIHLVPTLAERLHGLCGDPVFNVESRPYLGSCLRTSAVLYPRLCDGSLHVHTEVDDIRDDLHEALPDAVAARSANRHEWLAALQHDDRALI